MWSDLLPDDEGKKAYLMLYAVIVGCIKNRPLRLIMDPPSRDGREKHNENLMLSIDPSSETDRWHC